MARPIESKERAVFPSMKAAASELKLDLSQIKRASALGCDAFQTNGRVHRQKLVDWLIKDRAATEKAKAKEAKNKGQDEPDDDEAVEEGVGHTLKRLEGIEAALFRAVQLARKKKPYDPILFKIEFDAWVKIGRELLRYDLGVETAKRDAGELIPRDEVVMIVRCFLAWHQVAISDAIQNFMPDIVGLEKVTAVAAVVSPRIRESQHIALNIGLKAGKVPDWVVEAAKKQIDFQPNDTSADTASTKP